MPTQGSDGLRCTAYLGGSLLLLDCQLTAYLLVFLLLPLRLMERQARQRCVRAQVCRGTGSGLTYPDTHIKETVAWKRKGLGAQVCRGTGFSLTYPDTHIKGTVARNRKD